MEEFQLAVGSFCLACMRAFVRLNVRAGVDE